MSETKMIEVGGYRGVVDAMMHCQDPLGDRGWLRRPFQEGAAVFQFDAAMDAWVLRRNRITFLSKGQGEECPDAGFAGKQGDTATTLFPGGFMSTAAYFTIQGASLQMSSIGYTPKDQGPEVLTEESVVNRDGVARTDTVRLTRVFSDVFFDGSVVEFSQNGRTCQSLMGKASEFHKTSPARFKRTIMVPPAHHANGGHTLSVFTDRSIAIPRDKRHPAPPDGTVVVFTVRLELDGYFSNAYGFPLVAEGDNAEAAQADSEVVPERESVVLAEAIRKGTSNIAGAFIFLGGIALLLLLHR